MAIEDYNKNNNLDTVNINQDWMLGIAQKLKNIEDMERMAREGCMSLVEYLEIPQGMYAMILPDVQYKNLRFMAFELKVLIDSLEPIVQVEAYRTALKPVIDNIDNRNLFLKEKKLQGGLITYEMLPLFKWSYNYLSQMKSDIIKDIGFLLYIKGDEPGKKKW